MDSGDEPNAPDAERRRKRYHRHTPQQIQELEAVFRECPHPDDKQRMQLSRDLGLEPRQIKFWFQNRRTQMKAQHERADNSSLRSENDKIRCENISMREALKNIICPSCGGPPVREDSYFDEQKLRMDNARLKEELDRVSSIASKYLGRPITQLPPVQPIPISSLDLSVGCFSSQGLGPSLDLDLLHAGPSAAMPFPFPTAVSDIERPIMVEMATNAMEELIRLVQTDAPLWMKSAIDGRDILDLENYNRIFQRAGQPFKSPDIHIEASRDSGVVFMSAGTLVGMLMDSNKWMELFPTIVSKARTIEVLGSGMPGTRSGSLLLMYEELQVLSPVVPTRDFCFLRYCQQIEQGLWALADVSVLSSGEAQFGPPSRSRRLPSGCLIQDMANGYSKVTWLEHMEIEERTPIHRLYRELVNSGAAFGAQRRYEGITFDVIENCSLGSLGNILSVIRGKGAYILTPKLRSGGKLVIPSPDGKRSMMSLSQRMINNFCASISTSNGHRWTTLSGTNDVGVRVTVHKCTDPGQPNGVVLSAATSIWLPVSSQRVFSFFRDESSRAQWDVLSNGNPVQEVAHITNGSHPGNCISLLRALNSSQSNMLILQECCTDASGSLVVYAPVDLASIDIVMSGEDPSYIPILPSGFTISPDGRPSRGGGASSSSNPMGGSEGSLITVAFQILVSSLPSSKLNLESVNTVNSLISTTVQQIKAALNCTNV